MTCRLNGGENVLIRTLSSTDVDALHECWCRAFSDYVVPLKVSPEELSVRLRQDSYQPSLSVGAFMEGRMVGFWLSGFRIVDGKRTAYDAGTAVVKEAREKGISGKLYQAAQLRFTEEGVERYIIEVFKNNEVALAMYRKKGFVLDRVLEGFKGTNVGLGDESKMEDLHVMPASLSELHSEHRASLDYVPSWQNGWDALFSVEDSTVSVKVSHGDSIVGYAVFQPVLRRIAHIGVADVVIAHDIVGKLLKYFAPMVPDGQFIEMVNIPKGRSIIPGILLAHGFTHYGSLYEMTKPYN